MTIYKHTFNCGLWVYLEETNSVVEMIKSKVKDKEEQ